MDTPLNDGHVSPDFVSSTDPDQRPTTDSLRPGFRSDMFVSYIISIWRRFFFFNKVKERLHRHHIIPKHAGGDNSPSNIIVLTVKEHAAAHRALWLAHGRHADFIAYRMLSGLMSMTELRCQLQLLGARNGGLKCKGTPKPPRTQEYKIRQRLSRLGKSFLSNAGRKVISAASLGNKYGLGRAPWNKGKKDCYSVEASIPMTMAAVGNSNFKGKKHTEAAKQANRGAHLGRVPWNKGKKASINTREKLRRAHLGHVASEETRKKMGESHRGVIPYDRMERFTPEERRLFAQRAARSRWSKKTEVA